MTEERDRHGDVISRSYFDADGFPTLDSITGAAHVEYTFRARTETTLLYDEEQNPTRGAQGWHEMVTYHRVDDGGLRATVTYDEDHREAARAGRTRRGAVRPPRRP